MAQLERLMRRNFVEYASYSILDRAIPDLLDGLKPVQRRILHTLFEMDDGRYHKVANVIGETMKLHPHGDAAIGDALVVLANRSPFIDRQGNFGNLLTGHPAAAARYIECRLTDLARETLFNEALTDMLPSYDGRTREPVVLPAKLPVLLMLGADGIAVGMATRILPHNPRELWEAQVAILRGEARSVLPDFPQGGEMDASEYDDGRGKVRVRARIEQRDAKRLVIREIPYATTTEGLIASIESAAQKGRVKLAHVSDFTTDAVEIEVTAARGVTADELRDQLFAYTECEVSVSSSIVVIHGRRPVELSVAEALRILTERLRDLVRAELEWERTQLEDRRHWLTLEQIFVEKRVYKRIEEAESDEAVRSEVRAGMEQYAELLARPLADDDVKRLLDLRIRRISRYDIERNRREIEEAEAGLESVASRLGDLTGTTVAWLEGVIRKHGAAFPRRTRVLELETVDRKAVARQDIRLLHDAKSGFFGTDVKGGALRLTVSEYDLVLLICDDGSYRVVPPVEKLLLPARLLHCERFDPERGEAFTVVYRDKARIVYGKRVHVKSFVRGREYELIKGREGKLLLLAREADPGVLQMTFAPAPRQRVKHAKFDLATLETTGVAARGRRLASRPVSRVHVAPRPARAASPRPRGGGQTSLF
jgi:topoisomerase IV subunit A